MNILVIGGTRNVGHHLILRMVERGHRVTTFNRGQTPDELGSTVDRLHGDRTDPGQLVKALGSRDFDAVIDTIAMRPEETRSALDILDGRTGHYVHFSTGQVYLVRDGCPSPAGEGEYEGPLLPRPESDWETREWRYGIDKRGCEDLLAEAWEARSFPSTRLRLPMIHGERDHYGRIQGYVLRLLDGGPIVVPQEAGPPLKHIDQRDVVTAIAKIIEGGLGRGEAFNLASDEGWTLDRFLAALGELVGVHADIVRRPRGELQRAGVFPGCSPHSNPWMSVLDNRRAKEELGLSFAGFEEYLPRLADHFTDPDLSPPKAYSDLRERELELVR
jgi:nucleoside-diphosphate-sugar epimerase